MSLALGDEIRARCSSTEPSARGYRVPRVTNYLGQWIRCTDWWPDWQLRLYDRRAGQWERVHVHESVRLDGPAGTLRGELLHYPYRDISDHLDTIDRYTTLAASEMLRRRAADPGWLRIAVHPPLAFLRNYVAARRLPPGHAGPDRVAAELVLRAAQVREALGAAAAEPAPPGPRPPPIAERRVFPAHRHGPTWRGGQNQVLLTVLGLRAAGHRAMLVAHPDGELRRRAAEGLDLVPLAPGHELDLKAAWKLSRVVQRLAPDSCTRTIRTASRWRRWRCRCSRARPAPPLVASRRVDFRLKRNSFSRWKYRQVDLFIASSDAIRDLLIADGIAADERGHRATKASMWTASSGSRRSTCTRQFFLPHNAPVVGNVAALVPHKGQRHLIDAMPHGPRARCPTPAS